MDKKYICKEFNCKNKRTAKGLCQTHYDRIRSKNSNRRYQQLLKKCKDTGRKTNITEQQIQNIVSNNCYYCGNKNNSTGHGLDRIDSNKDYFLDNVVSCCGICNKAKSNLKLNEFYQIVINIHNNTKHKIDKLYENIYKD